MNMKEYTQGCLKTWISDNPEKELKYAVLEELGEICGKLKKFHRGDFR